MTLVTAFDLLIAQIEKAIQINARLQDDARDYCNWDKFDRLERFNRRLNSLYNKSIISRNEVTDLCIHGKLFERR